MKQFTLPSIEIVRELGRGADSVVYQGLRDGISYAVKVHLADEGEGFESAAVRFRREAAVLARLQHPALPKIMEVGEHEGRIYIIMEHITGRTLAAALEEGPLPEARVALFIAAICDALSLVHHHGLVHRDIKPENILFLSNGGVKLIDFSFVTRSRWEGNKEMVVGTFLYSAPEQTGMLKRPVDGRADLYALGGVLFEMLTGTRPFSANDIGELIRLHAVAAPPDPCAVHPGVSPVMGRIIQKLLAKDPDDRYQSAAGLRSDLERLTELNASSSEQGTIALDSHEDARQGGPFVARNQELRRLEEAWAAVGGRGGQLVLVSGLPGSGKSRLVHEFLAKARKDGSLALTGKCVAANPVPFAPLRATLDDWLTSVSRKGEGARSHIKEDILAAAGEAASLVKKISPQLAFLLADVSDLGPTEVAEDRFYDAIAAFFLHLSRRAGRAILVIDDVQWIDEATLQVVRRLAAEIGAVPLLLLFTGRSDTESGQRNEGFVTTLGSAPTCRIDLEALDDAGVAELVENFLGTPAIDSALVHRIAIRSGGNAFAVEEFLQAMLDAGSLRPSWGDWVASSENLHHLELSEDVLGLITRRISLLAPQTCAIFAAAALLGHRFLRPLLLSVCRCEEDIVNQAIVEGNQARVIDHAGPEAYAFVHDRIREALVATMAATTRQALHQRIAEVLDLDGQGDAPGDVQYALAFHIHQAGAVYWNERSFSANRAAAFKAGKNFAFHQALIFFRQAEEIAEHCSFPMDAAFLLAYGEACARTGQVDTAMALYDRGLDLSVEAMQRAALRLARARAHLSRLASSEARREIRSACEELGVEHPEATPLRLGLALWQWLWDSFTRRQADGQAEVAEEDRQRWRMESELHVWDGQAAYFLMDIPGLVLANLAARRPAFCLGPSAELADWYCQFGIIAAVVKMKNWSLRASEQSLRLASRVNDRVMIARIKVFNAIALHFAGRTCDAADNMEQTLAEHGTWLENADFFLGVADLSWNLLMRGYSDKAWPWIDKGLQRLAMANTKTALLEGHTFRCYAGSVLTMLGRPQEGLHQLKDFRDIIGETLDDRWRWAQYLAHKALALVELEETGFEFEETLALHARLALRPGGIPLHLRQFYVAKARGLLQLYDKAKACDRGPAKKRLEQALRELAKAARHPTLLCHYWVILGSYHGEEGRGKKAETFFQRAETLARTTDNPWVLHEVALARSRLLARKDCAAGAKNESAIAYYLAVQHNWRLRVRRLKTEHDFQGTMKAGFASSTHGTSAGMVQTGALQIRRYLSALLQVSLASATVLDPHEQARRALDEIVKILGAERAFLFLAEGEKEELRLQACRSAEGTDLADPDDYSKTIVSQVFFTRKPMVLSQGDKGPVDIAKSLIVHGLRSILAAPVVMRDRSIGVVYLDNRLARGMFTPEDLEILQAIANHIAIAMETARISHLEVAFEAERAQRGLAEHLRAVSTVLNSTLDLDAVLQCLLESLTQVVPYDRAMVMLREGNGFRVVGRSGFPAEEDLREGASAPIGHPQLVRVIETRQPLVCSRQGGDDHYWQWPDIEQWMILPLVVRDEVVGLLGLDSLKPRAYGDREAEIALTFASQAATAIENARLFGEVQRQAITDPLTGIANRRYFFKLCDRELARARRYNQPVSVLMLDIDFFKKVNDTYGHAAGDAVLQQMSQRFVKTIRSIDLVGRYGGEEFVMLLPDTSLSQGLVAAERIRTAIEQSPVVHEEQTIPVTISIGITSTHGEYPGLTALIEAADAALYQAKEQGRNRVVHVP